MKLFGFQFGRIQESGKALVVNNPTNSVWGSQDDEEEDRLKLYEDYLKAYKHYPLVTSIIDVQADQVAQEFYFEGPNKKSLMEWSDKINLLNFFHRLTKPFLIYGNVFVEVVNTDKNKKEIEQLKILDSRQIEVYRSKTGDVKGYGQIIQDQKMVLWGTTGNKDKDKSFKTRISSIDSIVHFKYNVIGPEKYGTSVVRPLLQNLSLKKSMNANLGKILKKYAAPLIVAKVGTDEFPANDTVVQEIANDLKDLQAESELTVSHLVDIDIKSFDSKGVDLQTPIKTADQEIITGGQVPPVLLGRSDGIDKATAEVSLRNFGRHIKAIQRILKTEFEDKIIVGQDIGTQEDKLVWGKAEEREWEIEVDILRGLVTDGILSPQKANDLLPPRFHEILPQMPLLNGQEQGQDGVQSPRNSQMKTDKVKDNPNDPTQTTKNKNTNSRVNKTDRKVPIK